MSHGHDNSRRNGGIDQIPAGGAAHGALYLIVLHILAAPAAEAVVSVPLVQLAGGDACKGQPPGLHGAEVGIFYRQSGLQHTLGNLPAPVKGSLIDTEEVGGLQRLTAGEVRDLLPGEGLAGGGREQSAALMIEKDPIPSFGLGGMIGIVVMVGSDVLDHMVPSFSVLAQL